MEISDGNKKQRMRDAQALHQSVQDANLATLESLLEEISTLAPTPEVTVKIEGIKRSIQNIRDHAEQVSGVFQQ